VLQGHKGAVRALASDPFGRFFVSGAADGYFRVWGGKCVGGESSPAKAGEGVVVWDSLARCEYQEKISDSEVTALAVTRGSTVAVGCQSGSLKLIDVHRGSSDVFSASKTRVLRSEGKGGRGMVSALKCVGDLIIMATSGGTITGWDPRQPRESSPAVSIACDPSFGTIQTLAQTPGDSLALAVSTSLGVVSIYDMRYLLNVAAYRLHPRGFPASPLPFDSLAISDAPKPGRAWLWGAWEGSDGAVGAWDVERGGSELLELSGDRGKSSLQLSKVSLDAKAEIVIPKACDGGGGGATRASVRTCLHVSEGAGEIIVAHGESVKVWESPRPGVFRSTPESLKLLATEHRSVRRSMHSSQMFSKAAARAQAQTLIETEALTGGGIESLLRIGQPGDVSSGAVLAGCRSGRVLLWAVPGG